MSSHPASSSQPFTMHYELVRAHMAEQREEAAAIRRARHARDAGGTERPRRVLSVCRWTASIWTALFRFRAGAAPGQAGK